MNIIEKKLEKINIFWFLSIIGIYFFTCYFFTNHIYDLTDIEYFKPVVFEKFYFSSIENKIPLWQELSTIYISIPFFVLLYITLVDRKTSAKAFFSVALMLLIQFIIYLIYPVTYIRPKIDEEQIFFLQKFIWTFDAPQNCFPSIHCSVAYFIGLGFLKYFGKRGLWGFVYGILICVSTLFTKQHYLVDVWSGIIFAHLAFIFFLFRNNDRP
jgi:membrane-associated phospholipid phosphatase